MENQTPFFKPKTVQKAELNIKSNSSKLSKNLLFLAGIITLLLIGMFIVYLQIKDTAPKVQIPTETFE